MLLDAFNDCYVNPLDLTKKDITYFNFEQNEGTFTTTTNSDNYLQNEMMGRSSRAVCKQDPFMHLHEARRAGPRRRFNRAREYFWTGVAKIEDLKCLD